jgi:hypothetical protein
MVTVCLMQLLPDDLVTQIIIHSIKDEPVINFLILCNKIYGTFRCICDSNEVLLHVSLCDLRRCARIAMSGHALSSASVKPIIWRHCALRG